jgi:glutathione synthase/RimK-type ligase-like ATP-grasp enzyme
MVALQVLLLSIVLLAGEVAAARTRSRRSGTPPAPRPPSVLIINGQALETATGWPGHEGVDAVFRTADQLAFTIETDQVRIRETVEGRDLASFGLVQCAGYPRPTASMINAIADYLRHHRVLAVNMAGIGAPTRLFQYVRFAQAGLPVPKTAYVAPRVLVDSFPELAQQLDLPFMLKALGASGGRYNFLVRNEREFHCHLRDPAHLGVSFLAQQFIPNDTTYRLLVLGGEVGLVMRRNWAAGTHLNDSEQGCATFLVDPDELDASAKQSAIEAARLIGSEVAGVNLIQHWVTQLWYVLDANPNPAMTTGPFVDDKLAAYHTYLRRRLGVRDPNGIGHKRNLT